ncbi:hypothetical protein [Microbacterium sp. CR_7]|uniref:hypothetical protein n=1 Tax=Microbacterium sp. CR_7 TaxID=3055792 RepID=UPI0035C0571A
MTAISKHVYSARVPSASGDLVLSPVGDDPGTISLDASRLPHGEASLTFAVEDAMMLENLDPRRSKRVVVDVAATFLSEEGVTRTRSFDLGIRRATPNRGEGTVTLDLATDEMLLSDYAVLEDDPLPRNYESSLRAVCEYVLSRVPGVVRNLEPNSRALSAGTMAPYAPRNSWVRSFVTTATPAPGAPATVVRFTSPEAGSFTFRGVDSYGATGATNPGTTGVWMEGPAVTPGDTITVSRFMRMFQSTVWRVGVRFHDGAGNWIGGRMDGPGVSTFPGSGWARPYWTGVVPAGAKRVAILVMWHVAQTVQVGTVMDMTGPMTEVTNRVTPWREQALEPGPDADVTAHWPVANLVSNPSFETNLDGWAVGTNATALGRFNDTTQGAVSGNWAARWVSGASGSSYIDYQDISIRAGESYVLSAYMYSEGAPRTGRVMMRFKGGNGAILRDAYGLSTPLQSNAWNRLDIAAVAPPGAEKATLHLELIATGAGQAVRADAVMFHQGTEVIPYYDGSTPESAAYYYGWTDSAHASNSLRTPKVERVPEAFRWYAGTTALDFLHPLLMATGLRIVCDENRRWSLRDALYRNPGDQSYRHAVNIETADETLSREADEWFDAAVYDYRWRDATGIEQRRVDAFALTTRPTKTAHFQLDTPYPGPGRAEVAVRRAQSRGRTVSVSAVPTWTEATDQTLSVLLEGTAIQTGIIGAVRFNLADDTVTVTSRTADTPASAWVLIPAGQRWIDSPAGGTWKNEVI